MIGYLEGRILRRESESILLLAGHIGYEVLLDPITLVRAVSLESEQDTLGLYIYYHVTERQPKPVLIGFLAPEDKEFFQLFITVAAIGPMKAVKALTKPVGVVARAIEDKDTAFLSQLSGIGKRTADKIIATLHGKVAHFAETSAAKPDETAAEIPREKEDISQQVGDVLVEQLGHSTASARRMIKEALERNPAIKTPEDLFDEIYQEN
ncbi:MAG: Holliday junction DNA helicase RuvA [Desulfobacter sp.]|nr:Holliday junction DNA helicase RuvA [Desulfobacter sp.]WDP85922.1 MAG: Holliday junction DNA helicase RuvA [Desulfobacter sp.]